MTTATKIDAGAQNNHQHEPALAVVPLSLREGECATLRPMVAAVERELASLRGERDKEGYAGGLDRLTSSWNTLVQSMALGTPPELRTCPHCQYRILVQATRCIQCWKMSDRGT